MSDFDQDPSANTGRFRAFVERGDEDVIPARRFPAPSAVLIAAVVAVLVIIIVIVAVA